MDIICDEKIKLQFPERMSSVGIEKDNELGCADQSWSLYETKQKSCEHMSYALGAKPEKNPIIIAAICYDLDNFAIKYINYNAHRKTSVLDHQKVKTIFNFYP